MRWEPQKTLFRGENCRWQKCVKHMCNQGFSPASARNSSLFFLCSHVSRSVSPTTTSQIQARKKRRGVSPVYQGRGGCTAPPRCGLGSVRGAAGTSSCPRPRPGDVARLQSSAPAPAGRSPSALRPDLRREPAGAEEGGRFHPVLPHQPAKALPGFSTRHIYLCGPPQGASLNPL